MPELIFIEIAAALAAKGAESLYELVKSKLMNRKQAMDALTLASGAPKDSPQVMALAEELAIADAYDQQFSQQLRAGWAAIQAGNNAPGGVANSISGTVRGNALQARNITGNVTFGSSAPPAAPADPPAHSSTVPVTKPGTGQV